MAGHGCWVLSALTAPLWRNPRMVRGVVSSAAVWASCSGKDYKKMTPQDWQKDLTPQQYHVTREGGTEPPFSGAYYDHHEKGMYRCVCCNAELFSSEAKFDSGSGWPSFHTAEGEDHSRVLTRTDFSHMMVRKEVLCRECNAHLGHVFPDGPEPTGLRYCINSSALRFSPKNAT